MSKKIYIFMLIILSFLLISCESILDEETYYTITFESNGGSNVSLIRVLENDKATKPEDPIKEGFEFDGWYSDSDFEELFLFNKSITKDITLYAFWKEIIIEEKTYQVTFNSYDGSLINSLEIEEGSKLNKPEDPIKEGYIFLGWFKDSEFNNAYDFNEIVISNLTLHAKWKAIKYTLLFDTLGGNNLNSMEITYGEEIGLLPVPIKDGFEFRGWYYNDIKISETSKNLTNKAENITLTANWQKIIGVTYYNITFNSNGGSLVNSVEIEEGSKLSKPQDPIKDGYIFIGWFTDNEFNNTYDFSEDVISNLTLYAKWEEITDDIDVSDWYK